MRDPMTFDWIKKFETHERSHKPDLIVEHHDQKYHDYLKHSHAPIEHVFYE